MNDPLLVFDKLVGDAVEWSVRSHHRRRLRKIGWEQALEPAEDGLWTSGDPPHRPGNDVEVLIDGAAVLPRIAEEVRAAQSHVHVAGWYVSPYFALERNGERSEVRPLLAELAERVDVRVLTWAGSPLPLFHPDRDDVDGVRHALTFGTRIQFGADAKERPMHCHHEKLVIVDDRVAFVGGVDLTSYAGDRYDTQEHRARGRIGWHDAAVVIRGPAVEDVAGHFRLRWHEVTGDELPEPAPPPRGTSSCSSCEPCRSGSTGRCHAATSASSRGTRAPCAPPASSCTSRTSSSGRARSRRSSRRS